MRILIWLSAQVDNCASRHQILPRSHRLRRRIHLVRAVQGDFDCICSVLSSVSASARFHVEVFKGELHRVFLCYLVIKSVQDTVEVLKVLFLAPRTFNKIRALFCLTFGCQMHVRLANGRYSLSCICLLNLREVAGLTIFNLVRLTDHVLRGKFVAWY